MTEQWQTRGILLACVAIVLVTVWTIVNVSERRARLMEACRQDGHPEYVCVGMISGRR